MVVFSMSKAVLFNRMPPPTQADTVTYSRSRVPPEALIPIDDREENVTDRMLTVPDCMLKAGIETLPIVGLCLPTIESCAPTWLA